MDIQKANKDLWDIKDNFDRFKQLIEVAFQKVKTLILIILKEV